MIVRVPRPGVSTPTDRWSLWAPQRRASTGRRSRDLGFEISGSRAGPDRAGQRGCLGLGYRSTAGPLVPVPLLTAVQVKPAMARRALYPIISRRERRGGWRSVRLMSDAAYISSDAGARRGVARRARGFPGAAETGERPWLGTRSHLAGGRGGIGRLLGVARKGGTRMGNHALHSV